MRQDVAAAGLVGWALEIWRNQPDLEPGAVAAVVGCAIGSTTVLISMVGHNWREAARKRERRAREEDVQDMKAAVAETLPGALSEALPDAMPPVIKALATRADPFQPG